MKIANFIEEGRLGGPQVRILAVASALKGKVDTTVIMPKENSEIFQQRCDACGVAYITLPISRVTKEWRVAVRYVLFSLFEVLRLAWVLKKNRFDLVHVSGGSWQLKGVLAAKLAGKKVLWHLNDTSMPGFIRRIFSLISPFADGFIFASERSRAYYGSLIREGKPEFIIPAPVETNSFDPANSYSGDESLISSWSGKLVVGTVANINPIKGLETLIRAAASLKRHVDKVLFVVVGPVYKNQNSYFNDLQQLCGELQVENIEFVGARSDVRPLLKRFDIYVCSSLAESSPISVWEAMAMGLPVISTDVGDVPLYVKNDLSGFIVGVNDSDSIGDRLALLAQDKKMRVRYGEKARQTVIEKLDLKRCATRHLDTYKEMLSAKNSSNF